MPLLYRLCRCHFHNRQQFCPTGLELLPHHPESLGRRHLRRVSAQRPRKARSRCHWASQGRPRRRWNSGGTLNWWLNLQWDKFCQRTILKGTQTRIFCSSEGSQNRVSTGPTLTKPKQSILTNTSPIQLKPCHNSLHHFEPFLLKSILLQLRITN